MCTTRTARRPRSDEQMLVTTRDAKAALWVSLVSTVIVLGVLIALVFVTLNGSAPGDQPT